MDQQRELFAGYIPGTIRSLKNSRRLVYPRLKGGVMTKPKFIPSKAYKKWEEQALASLIHQLQARKATGHRYPIDQPMWVKAYVVYSGNEPDLSNALEGVADVLQKAGIIADDKLIRSWDGSRKRHVSEVRRSDGSPASAGTAVWIYPFPEEDVVWEWV